MKNMLVMGLVIGLVSVGASGFFYFNETPVEKQARFISCLEQNLENTQNDCLVKILKVKHNG
jgi:hypothetical protein